MNERFRERMGDAHVRADTKVLGDLTAIYCRGLHGDRDRRPLASDGRELGVYGRRPPVLCEECAEHLRYGEKRRAYCPKDPKPFCAHCDTHCYAVAEAAWQRQMMRYSGPRSLFRGHAIDGIKHALETHRHRRASG